MTFGKIKNAINYKISWGASGQPACLLLRRSEFESRWTLQFCCNIVVEKNQNKQKEAGFVAFFKRTKNPSSFFRIGNTFFHRFTDLLRFYVFLKFKKCIVWVFKSLCFNTTVLGNGCGTFGRKVVSNTIEYQGSNPVNSIFKE